MRKIFFLLVVFFFSQPLLAQTIPVVQAYNVIGTRDKAPYNLSYDIVNDKPHWQAYNTDEDKKVTLYIAANGKYLQIVEVDTNNTKTIVQFRIVQTNNLKNVVVLSTTVITKQGNKLNSIKFLEIDDAGGEFLKNVLPKMTALNFITPQDLAGQEDLFTNGEVLYELSEKSNEITATAYYKDLEKDCLDGSKNACIAKNVIQPGIVLVWNAGLKRYIKATAQNK